MTTAHNNSLISHLVDLYRELDMNNVPKKERVIRITSKQAKELEIYLVNPSTLPDKILGCKLEIVDD